jgi:hypothetical protein
MPANRSDPPGAFPSSISSSNASFNKSTTTSKKKKGKKGSTTSAVNTSNANARTAMDEHDQDDDDDLPTLEEIDTSALSQHFNNASHHNQATPSDLLSTASDLYRQIEAAAASALSTHPSFAASFPPPPPGTGATTDEAYWTSLPQHLRQFIRSALPLAAGLTSPGGNNNNNGIHSSSLGIGVGVTGVNGQPLPPLTHEQLSSAAAQLAQVVQSNWGSLGLGNLPTQAQLASQANSGNGRGATISLGSFPVTMPTREQMEAAIGSVGAMSLNDLVNSSSGNAIIDDGSYDVMTDDDEEEEEDDSGMSAAARKKKNKKLKKRVMAEMIASTAPTKTASTPAAKATTPAARTNAPSQPILRRNDSPSAVTNPPTRAAQVPTAPPSNNINGKAKAPVASLLPTVASGKQPATSSTTPKTHTSDNYATAKPPPPPASIAANSAVVHTPSIAPKAGPSSERERIRDFWLGLKEVERRALVKVEKDAVLRKMKEQQRSGCSCAVCGRKR